MADDEGAPLLGLALGIGMGMWSTAGDGGIAVGLLAIVLMVGSIAWLAA